MVAKSYQNDEILGKPYDKNGKKYVRIRRSTGLEKEVRWYTDREYMKMYPGEKVSTGKPQKDVLGFREKGYIYLYEGDEEVLKASAAWYTRWWGWYSPELITDLPQNIKIYTLPWSAVGGDDGKVIEEKAKKYKKERVLICSTT